MAIFLVACGMNLHSSSVTPPPIRQSAIEIRQNELLLQWAPDGKGSEGTRIAKAQHAAQEEAREARLTLAQRRTRQAEWDAMLAAAVRQRAEIQKAKEDDNKENR